MERESGKRLAGSRGGHVVMWPGVLLALVLAGFAFVSSFDALRIVFMASGMSEGIAWMGPLCVDGIVGLCTWAVWGFKKSSMGSTWYPWAGFLLFGCLSVVGNMLHARPVTVMGTSLPDWAPPIIMSIPPVAFMYATHLIVIVASRRLAATDVNHPTEPKTTPVSTKPVDAAPAPSEPMRTAPVPEPTTPRPPMPPVPEPEPTPRPSDLLFDLTDPSPRDGTPFPQWSEPVPATRLEPIAPASQGRNDMKETNDDMDGLGRVGTTPIPDAPIPPAPVAVPQPADSETVDSETVEPAPAVEPEPAEERDPVTEPETIEETEPVEPEPAHDTDGPETAAERIDRPVARASAHETHEDDESAWYEWAAARKAANERVTPAAAFEAGLASDLNDARNTLRRLRRRDKEAF